MRGQVGGAGLADTLAPTYRLPLTSTSWLLARRGSVTRRNWFLLMVSLPSKIFRVCLPGPGGSS